MTDSPVAIEVPVSKAGERVSEQSLELSRNPATDVRDVAEPWMHDRVPSEIAFTNA